METRQFSQDISRSKDVLYIRLRDHPNEYEHDLYTQFTMYMGLDMHTHMEPFRRIVIDNVSYVQERSVELSHVYSIVRSLRNYSLTKAISHLICHRCYIGDVFLDFMHTCIHECSIREVSIKYDSIVSSPPRLFDKLSEVPMRRLIFDSVYITGLLDIRILARFITMSSSCLDSLKIARVRETGLRTESVVNEMTDFVQALKCSALKNLYIDAPFPGDESIGILIAGVRDMRNIVEFSIGNLHLSRESMRNLARALKPRENINGIERLEIRDCTFEADSILDLGVGIMLNRSLKDVMLFGYSNPPTSLLCATELVRRISFNPCIRDISFHGDDELENALTPIHEKSDRAVYLHVMDKLKKYHRGNIHLPDNLMRYAALLRLPDDIVQYIVSFLDDRNGVVDIAERERARQRERERLRYLLFAM